MDPHRIISSNVGRATCARRPASISSAMASCCLEGPRGFPGTDGTNGTNGIDGTNGTDGIDGTNGTDGTNGIDGTNGAPGAGTLAFSSGILTTPLALVLTIPLTLYIGQGANIVALAALPVADLLVGTNALSVPIPLAGTISNFVVSAAQNLALVASVPPLPDTAITYVFEVYSVASSLTGSTGSENIPAPSAALLTQTVEFGPTGLVPPIILTQQATETAVTSNNVNAGDRLGVRVIATATGVLPVAAILPTFSASFSYNYTA